jgi:hypothetical protein
VLAGVFGTAATGYILEKGKENSNLKIISEDLSLKVVYTC